MSDNVSKFCESVHAKLDSLQGRMDSLKSNIGTTWHSLQNKLDEVRQKSAATNQTAKEARASLEQWLRDQESEAKSTIDEWRHRHDSQRLTARAQWAEQCAWEAITVAQASIDDAERLILEAIAARLDAESVNVG
jgi:predicted  nucleic acid-binding Zn-ribbon protein